MAKLWFVSNETDYCETLIENRDVIFRFTSSIHELGKWPNSRRITAAVNVTILCNRNTDRTRSPAALKFTCCGSSVKSLGTGSLGVWLLMKAKMTCRCGPIASVRQTAGRTLVEVRS